VRVVAFWRLRTGARLQGNIQHRAVLTGVVKEVGAQHPGTVSLLRERRDGHPGSPDARLRVPLPEPMRPEPLLGRDSVDTLLPLK
jgi:hypothetical protein